MLNIFRFAQTPPIFWSRTHKTCFPPELSSSAFPSQDHCDSKRERERESSTEKSCTHEPYWESNIHAIDSPKSLHHTEEICDSPLPHLAFGFSGAMQMENLKKRSVRKRDDRPLDGSLVIIHGNGWGYRCLVDVRAIQTKFLIQLKLHRRMTPVLVCSQQMQIESRKGCYTSVE